jgi:hypothetical protein
MGGKLSVSEDKYNIYYRDRRRKHLAGIAPPEELEFSLNDCGKYTFDQEISSYIVELDERSQFVSCTDIRKNYVLSSHPVEIKMCVIVISQNPPSIPYTQETYNSQRGYYRKYVGYIYPTGVETDPEKMVCQGAIFQFIPGTLKEISYDECCMYQMACMIADPKMRESIKKDVCSTETSTCKNAVNVIEK